MISAKIKENSNISEKEGTAVNQFLTERERRVLDRKSTGHGKRIAAAKAIGIHRITLNNIINGANPKPKTVTKIRNYILNHK